MIHGWHCCFSARPEDQPPPKKKKMSIHYFISNEQDPPTVYTYNVSLFENEEKKLRPTRFHSRREPRLSAKVIRSNIYGRYRTIHWTMNGP